MNHDISVPVSRTPQFLAEANAAVAAAYPGVRIVAFGHMGDGNFHYTLMQAQGADGASFPGARLSELANTIAVKLGGSISAEHGVGVARAGELPATRTPRRLS